MRASQARHLPVGLLLAVGCLAACTDVVSPVGPDPMPPGTGTPGTPVTLQVVQCHGSRETLRLQCDAPASGSTGASGDILVGGQHMYVEVAATGVAYNSGTGQFTFTTTLQNLIEQEMGTSDDVTLDSTGIRIFFHELPQAVTGSGVIAVVPDGFASFTAAGQPYYQYNEILAHNQTSAGKVWTLVMPPTVLTFDFTLYVSAPVPYPNGYITLNGNLPGYYAGELHPGSTLAMTAVSKSPVGNVIPGTTITFSSGDPLCATVSPTGVITGVRAQNCDISAFDGSRGGYYNITVTGATRTWDGSASTDWSNGANWVGDLTPADVDSVTIPTGVPNFPALVGATAIGGVDVADNATLSLGSFDLTASANVFTGPTAGSGILSTTGRLILAGSGGTVHGRLPSTLITGAYAMNGDINAIAVQQVDSGELQNDGYSYNVTAQ